jgi:hypothetical protein
MVLLWFATSGFAVSHVCAQGNQRPRRSIELSETNSAEILTNLNQLTTKKDGFRQLDDQLRSLKGISTPNSMERRLTLPYVPPSASAVPSKALMEILERKKNWGLNPEEAGASTTASEAEALAAFGGITSDKKSSLQQFYDGLNHSPNNRQNGDRSKDNSPFPSTRRPESRDETSLADDTNLPPGIKDNAQKLKELVTEDSGSLFNPVRSHSSFENFFGLRDKRQPVDAVVGPKTQANSFMDQFKKTLNGPAFASGLDPAVQALLPEATTRQPASYPALDPLLSSRRHEVTETTPANINPANINAALSQATMPDLNGAILNQWNPLYSAPKLEVPKHTPPSSPNMDFPRRRF